MESEDNSLDQAYENSSYDSSLEGSNSGNVPADLKRPSRSPFRFNKAAFLVTAISLVVIVVIGLASLAVGNYFKKSNQPAKGVNDYAVSNLSLNNVKGAAQLSVGQADHLAVNGQLEVSNTLVIAPTERPTEATAGQIYYDETTNVPYYFNGTEFIPFVSPDAGVLTVQGQAGNVTFTAGNGIVINGTTISATAVPGITGVNGSNGLTVSQAGSVVTVALPNFAPNGLIVGSGSGGLSSVGTGSGGQCLLSAGSGAPPSFQVCPGGGLGGAGTSGRISKFTGATTLGDSLLVEVGTTITVNGALTVTGIISGNGSGLTTLNGSAISSGTVAIGVGGTGAATAQGAINNLSGLTTNGDLLYHNGVNATRLARGANGECLTSTAGTIAWASCTGGSISALTLAGTSGTPQAIGNNDTITIAAGNNITTTAGATDMITVATVNNPVFSTSVTTPIVNANGANLTLQTTTSGNVVLNSAGGTIELQDGTNVTGNLGVSGNTTLGDAGTDRLTITAQLLGATPLVFQGATDNGFATSFAITDPIANNTVTFRGDTSGTVCYEGSANCGFAPSSGSPNYIQNGTSLQTTANFHIQSAAAGSIGGIIRAATSQTADLLQFHDSTGAILTAFQADGKLVFGPSGLQDTNLYRSAANTLRTDDTFVSVQNVNSNATLGVSNTNNGASATAFFQLTNDIGFGGGLALNSSGNSAFGGANSLNVVNAQNAALTLGTNNLVRLTVAAGGAVTVHNLGAGLVQSSAGGLLTSDAVDRNSSSFFNTTLSVSNGGTGAVTFATNGILYGNTTGALQVTGAAASSVLVTDGSNLPSLSQTLPAAVQGNITSTGILATGSIASGFGTISTASNISTSAILQGNTVTVGTPGATTGNLNLANSTSSRQVVLQGLNPSGVGNATVQFPVIAGGATDTVCLLTLANCVGTGGGVSGTGTNNRIAKFTANGSVIGDSTISDDGTDVSITGDFTVQGGTATLGVASTQTGSLSFKHAGSVNTGTILQGALTGVQTYTLPDASGDFCLSSGNCVGGGGGAPNGAAYLTIGNDGTLSAERAITAGTNLSATDAGANSTYTLNVVNNPTFSGLLTANGDLTVQTGDTLTFNGDAFTDLTGTGLMIGGGALQTTLGVSVDLTSEVTGFLPIANGGTNAGTAQGAINNISGLTTEGDLLYHNGTNSTRLARGNNGDCLLSNATTVLWGSCSGGSITALTLAGTSGTPQPIGNNDTITIAAGSNITTTAGATDTVTVDVVSNPTFSGLLTANGGLTVEAGDTFTVNGDGFTDLTGNGLQASGSALTLLLQANKGLEVDVNGLSLIDCTTNEILKYNGSNQWACAADGAGSGVTTVGAIDTQTKSANGAVISSNSIFLQTADASFPGLVSTGTQTFAGDKTFTGLITGQLGATISGAASTITGATSGDALTVSNNTSSGNILVLNDNATAVASFADGGLLSFQPAAALTNGQTHITQTSNITSISGGTMRGYLLNQTITSTTTAGTNIGLELNQTDNSSALSNTNTGLKITLSGSNTSQLQYGADISVTRGLALRAVSSGTSATSATCAGVAVSVLAICADSTSTSLNTGTGLYARAAGVGGSLTTLHGTGVYGVSNAVGSGSNYFKGVSGQALQTAAGTYNSIGVFGQADGGAGAKIYGGYFTLGTTGASGGAALYASNSTTTANIFQLQDNATDVLTVADGGAVTAAALITANGGLTVEVGDTLTVNGDGFTDLTGNGLQATANALTLLLQANKGLEVDGNGLSLIDCTTNEILKYDGSNQWVCAADGGGTGVTTVGTIDTQTKSANGAVITGTSIVLQTADATFPGLVSTGTQTFAGDKTFTGLINGQLGVTISGATINLNNNSNFATNINTGTSTGAVNIGNSAAGTITLQSSNFININDVAGNAALSVDTINSVTSVRGINSDATIGSELNTATNFSTQWTNTGWTTTSTTAQHNTGNTNVLSPTTPLTIVAGNTYKVEFDLAGGTAGSVTPSVGGTSGSATASNVINQVQFITASTTGDLEFTPTSTFDGTLSNVSVRQITEASASLRVLDQTGDASIEFRGSFQGGDNTFIGWQAGRYNTAGSNTAVGSRTFASNINGSFNTAFGDSALNANIGGSFNSAIGSFSLVNNTYGDNNIGLGYESLEQNTTGSNNIAIGTGVLDSNITGSDNVAIGHFAGSSTNGSGNVFLGSRAGQNESGSNKLYVDNSSTSTPLIYGDFSTDELTFNGAVSVTGNTTLGNATTDTITIQGQTIASNSATGTTGNTESTPRTNVTTVTIDAAGSFANNDVIFIDNAGQDYYTRIVSGGGTTTLTVSPAVSYDADVTITKYNIQNIGATTSDYTTQASRFFQGYFLGGIVAGAGSTHYADGSILFQGDTNLYRSAADTLATDDALTIAGLLTANGNLTVQAGDTFTFNTDAFTDLTGNGLQVSANALTLSLQANKGLEVDGNGLSLIDCTNGEVLKYNGSNQWACAADGGGSGVTTVGTLDSQTKSANGAVISGSNLVLQTADASFPGLVSIGTQSFAGDKTFTGNVTVNGNSTLGNAVTDTITIQGQTIASATSAGITGTTTGSGTNTTSLTLTGDVFAVNDVIFIDNAGQDYYTRIATDPGSGSYVVSPAITFENARTVTKINAQYLGSDGSDFTATTGLTDPRNQNAFFQGYFTGGVVVGAGSTHYADGSILFQGDTSLYRSAAGELTSNSDLVLQGGDLSTNQGTASLFNATATTVNIGGGATIAINIGPSGATGTTINLAGGSGASGCSIDGATGSLNCAGLLTGQAGATTSGAAINLNNNSNFVTNINTGTSTGAVNIGNNAAGVITIQSGINNNINLTTNSASTGVIVRNNANSTTAFQVQEAGTVPLLTADTVGFDVKLGGNLIATGASTGTTASTSGTGTNTTTLTFSGTTSFANNDVLFIDNAGQDYYTRIVSGGSAASVTVSPAITFENARTVTKYDVQNIGSATTSTPGSNNERFFQGYFTGGVVVGAGSTTLSDGNLQSSGNLNLNANGSVTVRNASDSSTAFQIQNTAGTSLFTADTSNMIVRPGVNATYNAVNRTTTEISAADNNGQYSSIAIGTDGLPVISYYNSTDSDLNVYHCSNITCTSGTNTEISAADNNGQYSSIAIGTDGAPVISHYNVTDGDLNVYKCANAACTSGTNTEISAADNNGQYSSIAIGTDGFPVISHLNVSDIELNVYKCANAACTSGTNNEISSSDSAGQYSSIAIATNGLPVISHYNVTDGDLNIYKCGVAACTFGSGGNIEINSADNTGQYSSIAIGTDGSPVISHYNATDGDLNFYKCQDNADTCDLGTNTEISNADNVGQHTSIAIGTDGRPIISHYNSTDAELNVYRCGSDDNVCGGGFNSEVNSTDSAGQHISIAIATDSRPVISYYNASDGDLNITKCPDDICSTSGTAINGGVTLGTLTSSFQGLYTDSINQGRPDAKFGINNQGSMFLHGNATIGGSLEVSSIHSAGLFGLTLSSGNQFISLNAGGLSLIGDVFTSGLSGGGTIEDSLGFTDGGAADTTTINFQSTASWNQNDIIFIDNPSGFDNYTRVTSASGSGTSMTVSPAVTYDDGDEVFSVTAPSNIGSNINGPSANDRRYFQGYFTGGIVVGTSTYNTTLSNGNLTSTDMLSIHPGTTLSLITSNGNSIYLRPDGTTNTGVVLQPTVNSTNALSVQNASSVAVLTADTTNMKIKIGTGTPTLGAGTTGALYVTNASEFAGRVLIGTTTNGFDTNSGQVRYSGTYRNTKKIRLIPEYVNAVLDADGSNNTGSLTSGYTSASRMNFYSWTTTQASSQDYDIVAQVPIPSDWSAWTGNISFSVCTSNNTASAITAILTDSAGTVQSAATNIGSTSGGGTPCTTYTTNTMSPTTGFPSGPTYTAGDYFTIRLHLTSPQNGDIRVGNIHVDYLSQF